MGSCARFSKKFTNSFQKNGRKSTNRGKQVSGWLMTRNVCWNLNGQSRWLLFLLFGVVLITSNLHLRIKGIHFIGDFSAREPWRQPWEGSCQQNKPYDTPFYGIFWQATVSIRCWVLIDTLTSQLILFWTCQRLWSGIPLLARKLPL